MIVAAPLRLWLVGCGNMAGAMLRRWIESGTVAPANVFVVNRHDRELPVGVRQGRTFPREPAPDLLLLGVKPQQLGEIDPLPAGEYPLISILAGVDLGTLHARFPGHPVVRAMPNLPVALGKGVVPLYGARVPGVDALMAPLGLVEWVASESLFDRAGTLSGCGPAFVYRFIDALAEGGIAMGLSADQARRLALATVEGAGLLAAQADVSPAMLADRVASPGGSTRQGLDVLDKEEALRRLLRETLAASERRTAEMAAEARK
ncbi:pyrroline-5-carboxylate reductase family protein [Sphingomonas sp. M1-B02]|uniref:pyrroline-5-carboxylate reductase family protein n=1 Tax=Sphingomonas sp. M1-B02 TaxID=3114300 RepID=UPI00223F9FC2|nr:pyrroline-5-carboxylate reductase [Sphingomonas sp. S6-11]UZK67917.1 pyrroline-5-carboxylate reductase [Sphingomonas sp. S6-11]